MRIVSLLPSATELAFALGLGDDVVGVSHECDYPPEARTRATVVHCAIPLEDLAPADIDRAVSTQLRVGGSIYTIDTELLRALEPDLILAQDLCEVCAPSGNETERAVAALDRAPRVLTLAPRTLREIQENIRQLGEATGRLDVAQTLIESQSDRLATLARELAGAPRRRVFFLEWTDPMFCGGHWVAEMIERAGGHDALARRGGDSVRVSWDQVGAWAPEVLIVSPCGAHLESAVIQTRELLEQSRWSEIPAVQAGEVYAVDASSYFARPGPRVFDGIEVLAHILHPERVPERHLGAATKISTALRPRT
ncbi:MAG TPA: cobalamin-binding protein [Gemmatimonadaceae bacterium]|nr:cobalamin-binding protein [Gemmatimonadaceae bacterium]